MANADYQTALKNGIDAARSGSRMMARLHLMKAADFAPAEVACHLWLAWVAETPADALVHLEDALSRSPRHALARVGLFWTKAMAEFDAGGDYAGVDLGELAPPPAVAAAVEAPVGESPATSAKTIRLTTTQRLSDLAEPPPRSSAPTGDAAIAAQAKVDEANTDGAKVDEAKREPLDLTRTVRIELIQRERPEDADASSLSQTCLMPAQPAKATDAASAGDGDLSSLLDEPVGTATIRLDPQAVKRALAETVIAEMTSPDRSTHTAAHDEAVAKSNGGAEPKNADSNENDASTAASGSPSESSASRVDAYTEPPPVALSPEKWETATASIAPLANGPRVLVVDDSPTVRKLVASTLESRGYRVAGVSSGYEAVEVLSQATPDALVVEVDLPRLDGLHLCKLLRTQEATRNVPVIFLTRRGGTMDRMRGKMVGATAYLTKPFRSASLLEEMAACCPVESS